MNILNRYSPFITYPIVGALLGPVLIQVPILGVLALIPLLVPLELYDRLFSESFINEYIDVDRVFYIYTLETYQAWLYFAGFFALLGIIGAIIRKTVKRRGSKNPTIDTVTAVVALLAILFISFMAAALISTYQWNHG